MGTCLLRYNRDGDGCSLCKSQETSRPSRLCPEMHRKHIFRSTISSRWAVLAALVGKAAYADHGPCSSSLARSRRFSVKRLRRIGEEGFKTFFKGSCGTLPDWGWKVRFSRILHLRRTLKKFRPQKTHASHRIAFGAVLSCCARADLAASFLCGGFDSRTPALVRALWAATCFGEGPQGVMRQETWTVNICTCLMQACRVSAFSFLIWKRLFE